MSSFRFNQVVKSLILFYLFIVTISCAVYAENQYTAEDDADLLMLAYYYLENNYFDPEAVYKNEVLLKALNGFQNKIGFNEHLNDQVSSFASRTNERVLYKQIVALFLTGRVWAKQTNNNPDELVFGVINKMCKNQGESHTYFIDPKELKTREDLSTQTTGLIGIGILLKSITKESMGYYVYDTLPGSPAELAGLNKFDILIAINGKSVIKSPLNEIAKLIKGQAETFVTLKVNRGAKELEFILERKELIEPIVKVNTITINDSPVAYVKIYTFFNNHIVNKITELISPDSAGIILDLRDNGGGYLDSANNLLDYFLPKNLHLYDWLCRNNQLELVYSKNEQINSLPLVVLINEKSASASELVAAIIQEQQRGVIVGSRSAANLSMGTVFYLPRKCAILVTTALFRTAKGKKTGETGVLPDIVVEILSKDILDRKDPQYEEALKVLSKQIK